MRRITREPSTKAAAIVTVSLVLVFGFTGLYVTAFHSPEPRGLKIAVVGSQRAEAEATHAIDRAMPGGFTFASYAAEPDAVRALRSADVHGVLVLGPRRNVALLAGAFGFAPTQAITAAAGTASTAGGRSLAVHDLDPLPSHDSRGLAGFFAVFGTLVPSIVFGALLVLAGNRVSARSRWPALVLFAAGAGLVTACTVDPLVGALRGHFWAVAGVAGLLALAAASTVHGLGRLVGAPGIAIAALVLVLLGQSSSGGALTFELEPGFYGAVSQLLPNGAAISAMRNSVYFHDAHVFIPLLVLCVWAAAGTALGLTAEARRLLRRAAAGSHDQSAAGSHDQSARFDSTPAVA